MMDRKFARLKSFDIAIVPLKVRIYGSFQRFLNMVRLISILYFGGGEGEQL
jgi:hypothetical protein